MYPIPGNDLSFGELFLTDIDDQNQTILYAPDTSEYKTFCLDRYYNIGRFSSSVSTNHPLPLYDQTVEDGPKIVNNKIILMEMYRHATRADWAELAAEKICQIDQK